jgi:hypothetical protein
VQLLGEMPKNPLNGVAVGIRTQLQQLVVIDEACFAHENPSSGLPTPSIRGWQKRCSTDATEGSLARHLPQKIRKNDAA